MTRPVSPERSGRLRQGFIDMFGFIGTAGRLLWRHWPTLLSLAFLASAAHWWIGQDLAVRASRVHSLLGLSVLMFSPLAVLTSYVLMMRVLRQSLPWAQAANAGPGAPGEERPRTLLDHLGSVLLPFLAVYAGQGYLEETIDSYMYEVRRDALTARFMAVFDREHAPGESAQDLAARLDTRMSAVLGVVILVAFTARWAIGRVRATGRARAWLGILGAYLEAVWIMLLVVQVRDLPGWAWGQISDRRLVRWVQDAQDWYGERLGVIGRPIDGAMAYAWSLLTSFHIVIVIPLAWLTLGAIIYGHRLGEQRGPALDDAAEERPAPVGPLGVVRASTMNELRERFGPLVEGLRLLVRTNMRPMLVFCVLFLIVERLNDPDRGPLGGVERWLWELERAVIGPQETNGFWLPFSYLVGPLNNSIQAVLLMCVLAAAVDRVVLAQRVETVIADRHLLVSPPATPPVPDTRPDPVPDTRPDPMTDTRPDPMTDAGPAPAGPLPQRRPRSVELVEPHSEFGQDAFR